jgi:phasin
MNGRTPRAASNPGISRGETALASLQSPAYGTNGKTAVPMNEHEQSKKFADKNAAIANETLAKGKAAAEQSAKAVEQSYSVTVENMRDYNLKMIDMAHANTEGVFEFARQLATAKSPSDMVELWPSHAQKQYEMLSEQIKELTALG